VGGGIMATKEESLNFITEISKAKLVTREEVVNAYDAGLDEKSQGLLKKMSVSEVLYFVGALIVSIGAYLMVFINTTLGDMTQIVFTLFFGLLNFAAGVVLNARKNMESVSFAFFLISAALIPFGLSIAFGLVGKDFSDVGTQIAITGITFAFFFAAQLLLKKNIFIFFNVIFGTAFFIALTDAIVPGTISWQFYAYRVMVIGLCYILLGKYFSTNNQTSSMSGFLYAFGILGFLGSAMALGGWSPDQNIFWELLFPILVFATLFMSVTLRSKSFLIFGTLFLMGFIGKITGEYFAEGIGWPIALMVCGLLIIGSGYLFVYIRKKYNLA
jgi:hypothetical protein